MLIALRRLGFHRKKENFRWLKTFKRLKKQYHKVCFNFKGAAPRFPSEDKERLVSESKGILPRGRLE